MKTGTPWHELYEELEAIVFKEAGSFHLVDTINGFYVHIDVFGEPDKLITTKDYSTKEAAILVALTETTKWR